MMYAKSFLSLRKVWIMSLCLLVSINILAQDQKKISGTIVDEKGEPIIGASVVVKNTTIGVITDIDGKFSMDVPDKATLNITYIGFVPQEISVIGKTNFDLVLKEDSQLLKDVVVIGYGSIDKKELTSAISHVSSKDFLKIGAIDPAMQIQGKVAGVSITNTGSGDPNSGASIQVRGASSRSAGLGPLIVINGVPGGNLHNINENDIESIDVLKDGAASAIYGTRGSNGVILVTTKKGAMDGKVSTTYDGYVSIDVLTNELNTLSASEFRKQRVPQGAQDYGASTDWMKEITRTGFAHNHTLTIAGGTAKSNYRATVDARKATGVDIRSDRQEYGARFSIDHTTNGGLFKFSANIAPRIINRNNSEWDVFSTALVANPTTPVMDPTDASGKLYNSLRMQEAGWNPVEKLKIEKNRTETKLLDWDITAKLNLLPLLSADGTSPHTLSTQITLAQQVNDDMNFWFRPSTSSQSQDTGFKGEASQKYEKNRQESLEWLLNYRLETKGHNIAFLGGYSYQYKMYSLLSAENKNFSSDALTWDKLENGEYMKEEGRNGMASARNDYKLIAFFGRVSYDYKQRYILTTSLRYEGSSKFGQNNKWGYFPALSAGWRISDESFMKDITWINDLKVRGDFGITGNQDFNSYISLVTMGPFGDVYYNGQYYTGWGANKNPNPDLKWEKGVNWNVGVDFSLFNKVNGSLNYYNRRQQDLLGDYTVPVPPYSFDKMFVNVGTMKNTGIEIELNADIIKTKDFSYSAGFVGATNNNKFVDFSNDIYKGSDYLWTCYLPSPGTPGPIQQMRKGQRIGTFVTLAYAGIDENGDWLVWNKDNTEKISASKATDDDKRVTGNGLPKFTASLSNTFRYKDFDLTLFFRGAFGFDIFNVHDFYYGLQAASLSSNVLSSAYSKNANITKGQNVVSDYFLEKGDYVKLDVVSLGYTKKLDSKYIERVRIYGTAKNLATFTSFSGVDPSTYQVNGLNPGTLGESKNYYPSTTQFLLGVQIDF